MNYNIVGAETAPEQDFFVKALMIKAPTDKPATFYEGAKQGVYRGMIPGALVGALAFWAISKYAR